MSNNLINDFSNCNICPRKCGVDRFVEKGFCGQDNRIKIARAALHYWEEPCISGERGSGTIFFSGCNMKCVYCQNYGVSTENFGLEVSAKRLGQIFLELQDKNASNINLVTPTHFVPQIIKALDFVKDKLIIPVVYNTGGYENIETIEILKDYIDIFITDIKYFDDDIALKYSRVNDYFRVSFSAAKKMISSKNLIFDTDDMLKQGVIIRHLVLPSFRKDSLIILNKIFDEFGTDGFILSLMSQYTPNDMLENYPEINRKLTSFEYNKVVEAAEKFGFKNCYIQKKSSADKQYIPKFDLTGVKGEI